MAGFLLRGFEGGRHLPHSTRFCPRKSQVIIKMANVDFADSFQGSG